MATPFSYINASVDLNEVCLHITYLFLKELVFVSDVSPFYLLSHENLHSFIMFVKVMKNDDRTECCNPIRSSIIRV